MGKLLTCHLLDDMTNEILVQCLLKGMAKVVRTKITDAILAHIRELVLDGKLREGDRLPNQNELAAQLGVSRPSLREALHTLNLMGAIDQRPGRGTLLCARAPALLSGSFDLPFMSDSEGTIELMETRKLIEVGMVELAADRATEEDLKEIRRVLKEMSALAKEGSVPEYRQKDLQFHYLIARATHNRFVIHLFMTISRFLEQFLKESFEVMPQMLKRSQEGHRGIFRALEVRDKKGAMREMISHLQRVQRALQGFYQGKKAPSPPKEKLLVNEK
jgi:GntR family transcriptional regulator, transcriptional repressor for pyruvate dehydrogenase complex